jgi:hypothetical protein
VVDLDPAVHTGRTLLNHLRALNPGTPMVVLADPSPASNPGLADPGIALLTKPVEPAALEVTARALINVAPSQAASEPKENPAAAAPSLNPERFRDQLHARYAAPFEFVPFQRNWGINE